MIPKQNWGTETAQEFMSAFARASEPQEQSKQYVQCITCFREGIVDLPVIVVYVDGTSYCPDRVV